MLDVYMTYDRILGDFNKNFPDADIMIRTGLHRDPYPVVSYYWSVKDHAPFVKKLELYLNL